MIRGGSWILLVTLVATACAGRRAVVSTPPPDRSGSVEIEEVQAPYVAPPGGFTREALPMEFPPEPRVQRLPQYPEAALASEASCAALILYHTELDGSASLVRLDWPAPPPEPYLEAFEAAIRSAVGDWSFRPARRIVPTEMPGGAVEPLERPIRFAGRAIIRFRVANGRGIVE